MEQYVDGYIIPVPKDRIEDYRKMSTRAGELWKRCGALAYVECCGDDVKTGEHTSFPQAVNLQDNEVVFFSWIVFESREHRDRVNKKVMQDPFMRDFDPASAPFDGQRMFWGGFKKVIDL